MEIFCIMPMSDSYYLVAKFFHHWWLPVACYLLDIFKNIESNLSLQSKCENKNQESYYLSKETCAT